MKWLTDRKIDVLVWPARSPDCNPIENLWGILVRRIYANNKRYSTVNELNAAISEAWDSVEPSIIKNLINSMPNRIFSIISKGGGPIKY